MNHPIPNRAVAVDPIHAAQVVADFAERVGLPVRDTYTVQEAAELARRLGYDCTPRTVLEFQRKKYIADPGDEWDGAAVYCLVGALEARRRWLPAPCPQHDAKKSHARVNIELARAEGVDPIPDLDEHTLEDLLLQLTQCDQRAVREVLYECIRAKLDGLEE